MGKTIAICNQAGGVGKTTTTRDLGYEFAARGLRVLLLDADSQGSLGEFLGLEPHGAHQEETFWNWLVEGLATSHQNPPPFHSMWNMQVGIANLGLIHQEHKLHSASDPAALFKALSEWAKNFDYIFIDCPPHISEMTVQALFAADQLLVPVQCQDKAVKGLELIQEQIIASNRRRIPFRPPLTVLGILPTLYEPRLLVHQHHLREIEQLAERLGCQVFQPIRKYVAVAEAETMHQPLKIFAPPCPATLDIEALADQVLHCQLPRRKRRKLDWASPMPSVPDGGRV